MPSEMQERIARAMIQSRSMGTAPVSDHHWQRLVKSFQEMRAEFPDLPLGGDMVSDAFRDALAVMKAMREPTLAMELRGAGAPGGFSDRYRAAIDAEITLAEGGSRDRD